VNTPPHAGIAERGKQLALGGAHVEALQHYREAMRYAVGAGAPELFLRHYTQCALESLERLGAWDEVLATCGRAREHYAAHPPATDVARKDLGSFLEREGVVLLRQGRHEQALERLAEAVQAARPSRLPLAETLAGWLRGGLQITADRLARELDRHRYWSVRAGTVRAHLAVALPHIPVP
jgi:tetratricopeptide (TPR) repeat protein